MILRFAYALLLLYPLVGKADWRLWGRNEIIGACGRPIPANKTRHLDTNSIDLICDSQSDNYIRTPDPFLDEEDRDLWKRLDLKSSQTKGKEQEEVRTRMMKLGWKKKPIAWRGSIPYNTIETWYWESLESGCDALHCGSHRDCTTDSDGTEHCVDVANCCSWDEGHTEYLHCSSETLTYEARFLHPSEYNPNWGPGDANYYDIIPNGYDLLPGEMENIPVSSNSVGWASQGTSMLTPNASVENNWNAYDVNTTVQGYGKSVKCEKNVKRHAIVEIKTLHRIKKQTPNAFRIPTKAFAKLLEWTDAPGKDGKPMDAYPWRVNLTDASEDVISSLARHSREFTKVRELEKARVGKGRSSSIEETRGELLEEDAEGQGFWDETDVWIRLFKDVTGRDVKSTDDIYSHGSIASTRGDYTLDIDYTTPLEPHTPYTFYISMYRPGVPFYTQKEDCWFQKCYYSKELPVKFATLSYDDRSTITTLFDWWGSTWGEKARKVKHWFSD